mmetsp:Transcript_89948/g.140879  ORF Transcript_89948/g.140879 Transcript_89948/m.140879 type:complete len:221 (-) Transcript_89948:129-791(-)|eukprot:CAMPEP_0169262742 /NCGR_PEP_ID=MMETSP1016-20121227/43914_1 /TAXON_ID=342587 /ORGANISM="Karlodinium micrum, Strain CCMP2283" /LENGTH=220 /DNA_ID=CAMNT_0009345377 /DNA_START=52 /DNA_END=714 /DNA_ORIENTATION=+
MVERVVSEPGRSARGGVARDEADDEEGLVKGLANLREHISSRNAYSRKNFSELEESRTRVGDAFQVQMILLKEIELERIDLQMRVQRLASMRQNWKAQYAEHQLGVNVHVDQRLVEEERLVAREVQMLDEHYTQVSAQVARLRDMRDIMDRKLSEKRQHLHLEGQIMTQCAELLERPFTTSRTGIRKMVEARTNSRGNSKTCANLVGASSRFPQLPQSAR